MTGQDFVAYREGERWGFKRPDGSVAVKATFDAVGSFSEGLARVRANRRWGFIDPSGAVVIEPTYEQARHFSGGYAKVKRDGSWGLIDTKGFWVESVEEKTSYLDDRGKFITEKDHERWERPPGQDSDREGE